MGLRSPQPGHAFYALSAMADHLAKGVLASSKHWSAPSVLKKSDQRSEWW